MKSSAGRRISCNIIPYFCRKLGKISQNLSSATVMIGALRVNPLYFGGFSHTDNSSKDGLVHYIF